LTLQAEVKLSKNIYDKLLKIQELSTKEDYSEALKIIDEALNKDGIKDAPLAYLLQSRGFIEIAQNRYKEAINSFEKMNSLNIMSENITLNTIYNIAQLYLSLENYKEAIKNLNLWLSMTKNPKSEFYIMIAQSYSLLGDYRNSIINLSKAIELSKKLKESTPISWYELLFSNYYEIEDYKNSIKTLHTLIELRPKYRDYWLYLSQIYTLNKELDKGLSIYEQAYNLKLLRESEILQFIGFLLQKKIYYKGSKLLDRHLKDGTIITNEDNLKLLFGAYFSAKEYKKSIVVLNRVISLTQKSKYHLQKARIYSLIHNSNKAIESYKEALKDKNLKEYYIANLELSYLYYEKGLIDKCKESLYIAKEDKKIKKRAIKFLEQL
jgi:tetratricopeptide (TPR) repeat protein